MAAAYGAGFGVIAWGAFRAGFWAFDRAVGVWFRRQDSKQQRSAA